MHVMILFLFCVSFLSPALSCSLSCLVSLSCLLLSLCLCLCLHFLFSGLFCSLFVLFLSRHSPFSLQLSSLCFWSSICPCPHLLLRGKLKTCLIYFLRQFTSPLLLSWISSSALTFSFQDVACVPEEVRPLSTLRVTLHTQFVSFVLFEPSLPLLVPEDLFFRFFDCLINPLSALCREIIVE
jgi:hypothetical protein